MPDHVQINCASQGCYAIITMHPADEERLRRTHESFYCPAGHGNHFPGKTAEQREREELEKRAARLERFLDEAHLRQGRIHDAATFLAGGARACPLGCGWSAQRRPLGLWNGDEEAIGRYLDRVGRDLADHLLHEHNATRQPVALLPERAGA